MIQLLKSTRILTPNGVVSGIIEIEDGYIANILDYHIDSSKIMDVGSSVIMPGLIDVHVHLNEPGRTEWEGFETGTKAAAAGGVTTLIEMPLNASPVTTSEANFRVKILASEGKLSVNCGFWGGVVPDNIPELDNLLASGVFGLKAFLTHSGIDEFPNTTAPDLEKAMVLCRQFGVPLLVHCELENNHVPVLSQDQPQRYAQYLQSRPDQWEVDAVTLMIEFCRKTGASLHIVHVSSALCLPIISAAKQEGLPVTAETCPHYLFFSADEIPDGATAFKCAPPIRSKENNMLLWEALGNGTLDFIASDHSPAPPQLKKTDTGNFKEAWGGIAGLQLTLPVVWTMASALGYGLEQVADWLSQAPARFIAKEKELGKISPGFRADLVVWSPETKFLCTENSLYHRHKLSPYMGKTLSGVVEKTFLGGMLVYDGGLFPKQNYGSVLMRTS